MSPIINLSISKQKYKNIGETPKIIKNQLKKRFVSMSCAYITDNVCIFHVTGKYQEYNIRFLGLFQTAYNFNLSSYLLG